MVELGKRALADDERHQALTSRLAWLEGEVGMYTKGPKSVGPPHTDPRTLVSLVSGMTNSVARLTEGQGVTTSRLFELERRLGSTALRPLTPAGRGELGEL